MATPKVDAFFDEFPFLDKLYKRNGNFDVKVSRVNESLLGFTIDHWAYQLWHRSFILNHQGDMLAEVCVKLVPGKIDVPANRRGLRWFFMEFLLGAHPEKYVPGMVRDWLPETVFDTFKRLGSQANNAYYVVIWNEKVLTIYKALKGMTILEYLEHERLKAQGELKKELLALEGLGDPCPSCGQHRPLDANYCPNCGTVLTKGGTIVLNNQPTVGMIG